MFRLFIFIWFLHPSQSSPPSPLPGSSPPLPTIPPPLFLIRCRWASHGYQLAMGYQVPMRLGSSYSIKAERGNPVGGKGSQNRQHSQRQLLLSLLGVSHEDTYITLTYM